MKIFIDVGGHVGETVEAVLDPKYAFDVVYTFEPVAECCEKLRAIDDPRVRVIQAGLLDRTADLPLYDPGSVAGSVFKDHIHVTGEGVTMCKFIEASAFLDEHVRDGDEVYMKLNCEGSEAAIVENLVRSGWMERLTSCLVDPDIRKIASRQHEEADLRRRLATVKHCKIYYPEEVQYGQQSQYGGIGNWLRVAGAISWTPARRLASFRFNVENLVRRRHMGYYKFQVVRRTPRRVVEFYYRHVKRVPLR